MVKILLLLSLTILVFSGAGYLVQSILVLIFPPFFSQAPSGWKNMSRLMLMTDAAPVMHDE
jgi:hypothetical protein